MTEQYSVLNAIPELEKLTLVWSLSNTDAYTLERCDWYLTDSINDLRFTVSTFVDDQLDLVYGQFFDWFNLAEYPNAWEQLRPSDVSVFLKAAGAPDNIDYIAESGCDCFTGLCAVIRNRLNDRSIEQIKLAAEMFNWTIHCGLFLAESTAHVEIRVGSVQEIAPFLLGRILNRLTADRRASSGGRGSRETRLQNRFQPLEPVLMMLEGAVESPDWIHDDLAAGIFYWILDLYKSELGSGRRRRLDWYRPGGEMSTSDPPPKKVFPNYTGVEQLQFIPLHFSTYDNWKELTTECPNCGWTGLLGDAGFELYAACAEVNCRKCQNGLAVIEYPTTQEAEAAGDEATVAMHKYMKSRRESFERAKLQSVDQLPDIPDSEFVLRWIGHEQTGHSAYMEIKYKGEVIHREAMFFEDGKRYGEVCAILKEKYGSRLIDVLPNYTGWVYLGGDAFSSLQAAKDARLKLFGRTTVPRDFNTEE